MPLILEATPGHEAANSYATVAEADAHALYRVGGSAFGALIYDERVQALVTATRDIDAVGDAFVGERATSAQALEWPRTGTVYGDGVLPPALVRATIELAMSYAPAFADGYTGGDVLNDRANGNIKREKTGPLEVEFFAPGGEAGVLSRFPRIVARLLAPLLASVMSGWGGRAIVSRGS